MQKVIPISRLTNQIVSFGAFMLFIVIGWVTTYVSPHALVLAFSAGALDGLAHELIQSGGKCILPTTDNSGNYSWAD